LASARQTGNRNRQLFVDFLEEPPDGGGRQAATGPAADSMYESMTSRAESSQLPQQLATGKYACTSLNDSAPRSTHSRIWRSLIAWQTQTYMWRDSSQVD